MIDIFVNRKKAVKQNKQGIKQCQNHNIGKSIDRWYWLKNRKEIHNQ